MDLGEISDTEEDICQLKNLKMEPDLDKFSAKTRKIPELQDLGEIGDSEHSICELTNRKMEPDSDQFSAKTQNILELQDLGEINDSEHSMCDSKNSKMEPDSDQFSAKTQKILELKSEKIVDKINLFTMELQDLWEDQSARGRQSLDENLNLTLQLEKANAKNRELVWENEWLRMRLAQAKMQVEQLKRQMAQQEEEVIPKLLDAKDSAVARLELGLVKKIKSLKRQLAEALVPKENLISAETQTDFEPIEFQDQTDLESEESQDLEDWQDCRSS